MFRPRPLRTAATLAVLGLPGLDLIRPAQADGRPDLLWLAGGHGHSVYSLSFSADGSLLVSASHDRTVKVWHAADSTLLHTITLPFVSTAQLTQIPAAGISSDGQTIAASIRLVNPGSPASYWANVRLFDAQTGVEQHMFPQTDVVSRGLALSSDGSLLAEGGEDVRIWDVASRTLVTTLPVTGEAASLEFSPDGSYLAGAFSNGRVRIWSTAGWVPQQNWVAHTGQAQSVAFRPNAAQLASTGDDGDVTLWEVPSGAFMRNMLHGSSAATVAFSPDGSVLASGGSNSLVQLWNPDDGALLGTLTGHGGPVLTAAFAPDGQSLLSAGGFPDFSIRRWNAATGDALPSFTAHAAPVPETVFTPDGQQLLTVGSYDQSRRRWDAVTGAIQDIDTFPNTSVLDVAVSPDGQLEALPTGGNFSVVVRRTSDGAVVAWFGTFAPVAALEFSPDGTILAVGHDYFGGTVQLFSVPEFESIRQMGEGEGPMGGLVFSPDGALLATSNGGSLNVFRVSDGATLPAPNLWAANCAFSPDGTLLAVASTHDPDVTILLVSDFSTVTTLNVSATDVDFSPDGRYLLTSEPARLTFWRVSDWSPQESYDAELGFGVSFEGVRTVRYSPDGCLFAYGRHDATVAMARNPFALLGDVDGDLRISLADLAVVLAGYGTTSGATYAEGDLDGDQDVDLTDLATLLSGFGNACP